MLENLKGELERLKDAIKGDITALKEGVREEVRTSWGWKRTFTAIRS